MWWSWHLRCSGSESQQFNGSDFWLRGPTLVNLLHQNPACSFASASELKIPSNCCMHACLSRIPDFTLCMHCEVVDYVRFEMMLP